MSTTTTPLTALTGLASSLWSLNDGDKFELPGPVEIIEHYRAEEAGSWPYETPIHLIVKVGDDFYKIPGYMDSYSDFSFNDAKAVKPSTKTVTVYE